MTRHEWNEYTPEDGKRFNRASHQGTRWKFETTLASEEFWHDVDPPSREFLEGLREILFRKYQRKRLPHRLLAEIDVMLEELPLEAEADAESEAESEPTSTESGDTTD